MEHTLVLNRSFVAIQITDVKTAIRRIYTQDAEVVCEGDLLDKSQQIIANLYQTFDFQTWVDVSQRLPYQKQDVLHSVKFYIRKPSIIRLIRCNRLPQFEVCLSRQNLRARDRYRCQYCGIPMKHMKMTLDHILPKSRGGKTTWDNVVLACVKCNQQKGNKTLEEAHMTLLKAPTKPRWFAAGLISQDSDNKHYTNWKPFLNYFDIVDSV